jgi:hypothetical protein
MRIVSRPALALAAAALLAGAAPARDLATLLARIKAVGPEGAGGAEAAAAWKEATAAGPDALPDVLASFDGATPRAANYLRPLADNLVAKGLADKKLPIAKLEAFLADHKRDPRARRIAYEALVQADPKAPERLLPGMLLDPSPELRRDAVAAVIKDAEAKLKADDKEGAKAAFQKALKGACDDDQVDAIAKALDGLGVKIDVANHLGFVRRWHLAGPFEGDGMVGFRTVYPPEKGVDLAAKYKVRGGDAGWAPHTTTDRAAVVNLNKALRDEKEVVAFAHAVIESAEARPVQVRLGCLTAVKVFLNGKEIFQREEYHHGMRVDQYVAEGALRKGRNELLVKVVQNEKKESWEKDWFFQARLCDSTGVAVPFTVVEPGEKKEAQP